MMRRALTLVVRFYRCRISGRGSLASIACTFGSQESCSAFAERTLRDTPSVFRAVCRIFRRLVRCRDFSLYALGNRSLGGGEGYDPVLDSEGSESAIRELDRLLRADGETETVRASVCKAAAALTAGARGEHSVAWDRACESSIPIRDLASARTSVASRSARRKAISGGICAVLLTTGVTLAVTLPVGKLLAVPLGLLCLAPLRVVLMRDRYLVFLERLERRRLSTADASPCEETD